MLKNLRISLIPVSLFLYSNISLAIENNCYYNYCYINNNTTLDLDSYNKINSSSSSAFVGSSTVIISDINAGNNPNPNPETVIKGVKIVGLNNLNNGNYFKFNPNVTYDTKNEYLDSLKTPFFNLYNAMSESTFENGIFAGGYNLSSITNNEINNSVFFAMGSIYGEVPTNGYNLIDGNKVNNGQMIIWDRMLNSSGEENPTNIEWYVNVKGTIYNGTSDEIIISDSLVNNNLSSSNSEFKDTSNQYLSGIVSTENPIFNDKSTQILKNNSSASNVTLNDDSESTVYNSAKQIGTTTVNGSAQLTLITGSNNKDSSDAGAYAENVNLNGEKSQLNIVVSDSDSLGNTAFIGTINGTGKVSLGTDKKGNYSNLIVEDVLGDNSYTFDVDIANKKGSLLTINNSSDGIHIANAINNGSADTNGSEKITIIEDKSGENANATFESDEPIELGGYTYTVQRDSENANNWVVIGKKTENGDSTINDTAKSITGLASSSYLLNQAELSTLRQRMGDLITDKTTSSTDISGVWGRVYGGRYKTRDNANLAKVNMNYYGFQLGGDINTIKEGDDKNHLGVFIGHTTGKPDYVRGDSTVESWYGGVYDTFITEDNLYIDSVIKFGQYRNKYSLSDSADNTLNGKVKSNVLTLSSEIGKRFILTSNDAYNLYLEPQAQLTWSRIGAFKTGASNGLNVKQDAYNSTIGRLGALFGSQINKQSDFYLKVSYLHEFKKNVKYKLNASEESYNVQGNGVEVGIGGNVKLNENGYLYLEANYINSHAHYTGSKFNVGYRYSF